MRGTFTLFVIVLILSVTLDPVGAGRSLRGIFDGFQSGWSTPEEAPMTRVLIGCEASGSGA